MDKPNLNSAMPTPIFEAVPGWGGKTKKWLKKNLYDKIFPMIAVLVLLVGIAKYFSRPNSDEEFVNDSPVQLGDQSKAQIMFVVIQSGEGIVATSRRAVDEYLKSFLEIELAPEQKLYIDNFFTAKFSGIDWKTGTEIEFLEDDMRQAIDEALALPESKLKKFRTYLK